MANRYVIFECDIEGHEDLLNVVCLEEGCKNPGLICQTCLYYSHKNHLQKPLKVFLNEYKQIVAKAAKDTPSATSGSSSTPNPAAAHALLAQNLKKTKVTYEQITQKITAYSIRVQDQLESIQNLAREYYEDQVVCFKRAISEKFKSNNSGPNVEIAEFINQGKQIIESIERSVPVKAEEQRNLVNTLAANISIAADNQELAWKNAHLLKAVARGPGSSHGSNEKDSAQKRATEKLQDIVVTSEANMMDIFKSIEQVCTKFDMACTEILGHISTAKAEVTSQIDSQMECEDDLFFNYKQQQQQQLKQQQQQQEEQQQKPSPLQRLQHIAQAAKPNEGGVKRIDDSAANHNVGTSNEQDDDSLSRMKRFQTYLNSHSKKQEQKKPNQSMEMIDEDDESTGTFSACKDPINQQTVKQQPPQQQQPPQKEQPQSQVVQRGYAQRLTSLTRSNLNKTNIVQRSNSDMMELFSSTEDSDKIFSALAAAKKNESSNNRVDNSHSLDYFQTLPESKGKESMSSNNFEKTSKTNEQQQQFKIVLGNTIKAHKSICKDIALIEDDRVATCSFDGYVKIWDVKSGRMVRELKNHTKRVNSIVYSSKYEMLVSVSDDGLMLAYKDLGGDSWEEVLRMKHEGNNNNNSVSKRIQSVAFYELEDCLLSGLEDGEVQVWRINDASHLKNLDSCKEKLVCLRVITEKKFVLGAANSSLYIWRIGSGKIVSTKKDVHKDQINDIVFLKHGEDCFATAGDDRSIKIWSLSDYSIISELTEEYSVSSLCFAPNLSMLLTSIWGEEPSGQITVWNLNEAKKVASTVPKIEGITKIKYINKTSQLVCALDNGSLEIYSVSKK